MLMADSRTATLVAIDRLLKKDPNDRFATAEALVEAIDAAQLSAPEIPLPVRLFQQSGKSYLTNAGLVILVAAVNVFRSETEAQLDKLATLSAVLEEGDEARAQSLRRNDRDHRHLHDVRRGADPHP